MKALHVRFEGLTASYPYPFLRSGTALTLPVPPYSSVLGMLGACVGSDIVPQDLWLGYEFACGPFTSIDLERTERLQTDKQGQLRANPERGVAQRQFHIFPKLDVYVNDISIMPALLAPVTPPRFGCSQDLAWVKIVREIELVPIDQGGVRGTLVPYPETRIGQILPPLVDFYMNEQKGLLRQAARISRYAVIPSGELLFQFTTGPRLHLYKPSDSSEQNHAILMQHFQA